MSLDAHLEALLADLQSQGLLRDREASAGAFPELVDVCSNDYLGYAAERVSRETSVTGGTGASRLIHGTRPEHVALEAELAAWVQAEDALLFSSGYAANVGVLSALARPGDLIVSDSLNHASIIDGCRLSGARVRVVPHLDPSAVEAALKEPVPGRRWVVTESYFSMDADTPDLARLRAISTAADAALIVDEAHALGVFGPEGAGLSRASRVSPEVLVGTLGKAVGIQGAFVAGSRTLTRFLWNRARSFVFSTAPSPALSQATLENVRRVRADDAARARLRTHVSALERALHECAIALPLGRHGPIFPIVVGSPERALAAAEVLRQAGFRAQAIRPPTVPAGSCRLRITLHADLTDERLARLVSALRAACSAS